MNDPSSDGNENVIDIFVLCKSETEAPLNTEHLEQKGYRVTLFSDSTHLFETLRYGKPNLLICDSVSLGADAFEICRQIKADNELWMIPVLIMTGASSLGDLLYVLDCNADNFIAYPYDPPYLHSLIEGMLITPVERQTPEQIKTQFKIQHDDHLFVVTADRRKLLEFLLSSFEIAVNKSEELVRAISENNTLRQAAVKADEVAAEQGRVIEILNGTVQQREQAISALNDEMRDKANQIAELSREKEISLQECEEGKRLLGAADDQVRTLVREKEEAASAYSSEIRELNQRNATISEELTTTQADLKSTRGELEEVTARRNEANSTLAELVPQKEQLEKSLRASTLECEQLRSSCSGEQNRALAAEQENKSLVLAKAQAEEDLTKIISELKDTARQQATELITLREEQVADKSRVSSLENQLATLVAEKEQTETGLKKTAHDLQRELEDLRATSDTTTATLDEKTRQAAELERMYNEQKAAAEEIEAKVQVLDKELAVLRPALEEKSRNVDELEQVYAEQKSVTTQAQAQIQSLENELAALRSAFEDKERSAAEREQEFTKQKSVTTQAQAQIQSLENEIAALRSALEDKERNAAEVEQNCNELKDAAAQALDQIHSLDNEIAELRSAIELEKQQHARTRESLQGAHNVVKSDLDSHRDDLARAKQDLVTVSEERSSMKVRLDEALTQIGSLEDKLHTAAGDQAESDKQIRSFSDELEQVKAALEAERDRRRSDEEKLHTMAVTREKDEETARQTLAEQERLTKILDTERDERRNAEERLRALEDESERRVRELSDKLAVASARVQEFEDEVRRVAQEKADAEAHAASLETEIDQARAALADEWEDHMTDNERFAAAGETVPVAGPAVTDQGHEPAAESYAVITRTSALPAEVSPLPKAVVAVPAPAEEPPVPRVTSVEDLFEDYPDTAEDPEELPSVTIIRDPAPEIEIGGVFDTEPVIDEGNRTVDEPDADETDPDIMEDQDDPEGTDETDEPDEDDGSSPEFQPGFSGQGIAFDRAQWFDLLKWAHHSGALSQEQRIQVVRMGRLIQKGRRLTHKQDEQVRELIGLVHSLGYRFS
jgi:chromosome segregation ATPase